MNPPPSITVTGVDESTEVEAIVSLSAMGAEIGFLYTVTPEGRNRYPGAAWITEVMQIVPRGAVHICGRGAREKLHGGWIDEMVERAQRIQLNGFVSEGYLQQICDKFHHKTIITQDRPDNAPLIAFEARNHAILVDGSGGRGIRPDSWKAPKTNKPVGFAGGIGPDNIIYEVVRISAAAKPGWWIDMEGRLRDEDDLFDAEKARKCIEKFHSVTE